MNTEPVRFYFRLYLGPRTCPDKVTRDVTLVRDAVPAGSCDVVQAGRILDEIRDELRRTYPDAIGLRYLRSEPVASAAATM